MSVVSSWFYACIGAFGSYELEELSSIKHKNFIWIIIALDVFFGLCILKNLLTGFMDQKSQRLVTDLKLIAINYMRGNGVVDILIWVPFQTVIYHLNDDDHEHGIHFFFWIKVLRVQNVFKLIPIQTLTRRIYN